MIIYERLLPCEIRVADALCIHGRKRLSHHFGVAEDTIKHQMSGVLRKTGCFDSIDLVRVWECELFQEGLRALGIRR